MENEATSAGLRLRPRKTGGGWDWKHLREDEAHESLTGFWSLVEQLPVSRLSYRNADELTRYENH